ncbi:DEAD-box helicase Dbp80-like isoform X2 [Phymastichus coffea]|nr:DEAD-box helicase Dbp80-like isoform X2 [Phymastichus coffea]XP_058793591.1 DEAD-box helicase Dbp80-like isoform X2 [Phymastichus coffea]XP_058793592.1 DEAD-box helicase Dbp80-like isoform X2 [Phymastichus coffea]XP_058793593.1 DEAD-box helicase Dbp80-like isoform X2 [Phymastichus coffea]
MLLMEPHLRRPHTSSISSLLISGMQQQQQQPSTSATELYTEPKRLTALETYLSQGVQHVDSNSPLYSAKTFEELNLKTELLKAIYEMKYNAPSKIQEQALPILLANPPKNLIAQSQSGTGKTAAFTLALLSRVDSSKPYPQVLCLSPTFELALQTEKFIASLAKYLPDIKLILATKGENLPKGTQIKEHVVIGTPGKVLDWALKYRFFDPKMINVFVLDEADIMISIQGYQDQCLRIHGQLNFACQLMFFSATFNDEIMLFAEAIVTNPVIIRLKKEEESLDNIKQYYALCQTLDDKYEAIDNIYGAISIGQTIIFCHTKKTANWLSDKMTKDGHSVGILSGDLTVEDRVRVLHRFREGLEKVLITTNVLARGIDVEQVTVVVNFDMPVDQNNKADYETYLHRIGRTGRFEKKGIAINLIDSQHSMLICRDIQNHFRKTIALLNVKDPEEIEKIGS